MIISDNGGRLFVVAEKVMLLNIDCNYIPDLDRERTDTANTVAGVGV